MSFLPRNLLLLLTAALFSRLAGAWAPIPIAATISPESLKCERSRNPMGIGTATPRFSWTLHPQTSTERDLTQTGYQILIASSLQTLAARRGDLWDSGKVASASVFGAAYAGKLLASRTPYFWTVRVWDGGDKPSRWSEPAQFTTALLQPGEWDARWIAATPDGSPSETSKPLPIFRHGFHLQKEVKQAVVFISGLGGYEAHINGRNITDAVLTPGWSDYRKRVLYNCYDVTTLLHPGDNAVGVMLGNGMYNVEKSKGRYTKFVGSFGQPRLIFQLHVRFSDGSETVIAGDKSWKTTPGPILFSSIYGGEDYDARREQPGWDMPGFNDATWQLVFDAQGPGGALVAEQIPPVKMIQTYSPQVVTNPKPGVSVYDLGENISGWPEIAVTGEGGSSIKLIAGELLTADGLVTQRSANAFPNSQNSFTYILKGGGMEYWHPRFAYYGFRYVQMECSAPPKQLVVQALKGQFLHDNVEISGAFASSDELFMRIHNLIDRAILSNMVSVLTDCPHREKLGWLEQTHLAATSIMYNYDVSQLYQKMSDDMQTAQLADGMVPSIAPEYVAFLDKNGKSTPFRDSPEWGSAMILSPWAAYQFYGDVNVLREHYGSMKRYAEYLRSRTSDGMLGYGLGDWYDIGPGAPGKSQLTGTGLTATALYYQDLKALSQIAALLNEASDETRFSAEAAAVKASFNAHLFHPETNEYDRGSQTANAMPLAVDLVPEDHRDAVLANLVKDIREHSNHVTAGDIGFHYVVRALADGGRSDVLYDMLSRTDPPSYGYQLLRGATTLTEAWDTNPNSSQNHFMLGHAEEWFYRGLAGIDFDLSRAPDERIRIQPSPAGEVSSASASYESTLGYVQSRWSRTGTTLRMDVTIPPGATATVRFPPPFYNGITESGHPLAIGRGVHALQAGGRSVKCVIGSGEYHFQARR